MTPALFKKCGLALFPGHGWKSRMAEALRVDRKTIYHWDKGDFRVPDDKAQEIYKLVALRLRSMKTLIENQLKDMKC